MASRLRMIVRAELRDKPILRVLAVGALAASVTVAAWGIGARAAWADAVKLEAGTISYVQDGEVVKAEGNVSVRWNENELHADQITLEKVKARLQARGDLRLRARDYRLTADSMDLGIDDETGIFRNVQISLGDRPGGFGGRLIEKHLGQNYTIRHGYYTTCHLREDGNPDWDISAEKIDVQAEQHGTMQNGLLRVRGVPILYLPYFVFPVGGQRRSGLLQPNIGNSSVRGAIYYQPFFWDVSKHIDLTTTVGIETAARGGVVNHLRYRPSRKMSGDVRIEYYNEKIRGDAVSEVVSPLFKGRTVPVDRTAITAVHRQQLSADTDLYVDLLASSDDLFFREIDALSKTRDDVDLRRKLRYARSDLGVIRRSGFSSFGAEAVGYQDFISPRTSSGAFVKSANSFTVQKPVDLWVNRDSLWRGLAVSASGTLSHFQRDTGTTGQRLDLRSKFERALTPDGPVESHLWASARATAYHMDARDVVDVATGATAARLNEFPLRGILDAGLDVRTELQRTYARGGGAHARLTHTVAPFATLRRTSGSSRSELPLYDGTDSIQGRTTGTYGVESRLLRHGKDGKAARELARLSLSQTYNFSRPVRSNYFSDIDFAAVFDPNRRVSINSLVSFDAAAAEVTAAIASLAMFSNAEAVARGEGASIGLAYDFVRDGGLESVEGRGTWALNDHIGLGTKVRYDFVSETFIEEAGSVRIRSSCDCWAINLVAVNQVNPSEFQFRISVELGGIGTLGSAPRTGNVTALKNPAEHNWRGRW